jgi:all-trans-retinol dehydrogenase (NAD+)
MSRISGATALVTGGASGIGYLTGRRLLEAGAARLLIWDIDTQALERVTAELAGSGFSAAGAAVDITDLDGVRAAVHDLVTQGEAVDILVNNAGIVVGRDFVDHSHADIRASMAINALAPMHIALELLPDMIERGRGHIVNIASAAGLTPNPRMAVYCASKWAVTGWSESLRIEMERGRTGVAVTTVAPYYISTGMFEGVRSPVIPILRPEYAARRIVEAIRDDRILLRMPRIVNVLPLVRGLLPARAYDRVVGRWLRVYETMSTFRGRSA